MLTPECCRSWGVSPSEVPGKVDDVRLIVEPARNLHLNPVGAARMEDFSGLAAYAYSGHSALFELVAYVWQHTTASSGALPRGRARHETDIVHLWPRR